MTVINLAFVRCMAVVDNIGLVAEIGGALFLIVALTMHVQRGPATLVETNGTGSSWSTPRLPGHVAQLKDDECVLGFASPSSLRCWVTKPGTVTARWTCCASTSS